MKKVLLIVGLYLIHLTLSAQVEFGVSTGVSGLRNFSPQQKFWAFGQTVRTYVHLSPKETVYAWLDYYTEGKFKNAFTAIAKSPLINPQEIGYIATGRLTYRHFSLGWKHYFRGAYDQENDINIYGLAGFGFLFARVRNSFSIALDSNEYHVQPIAGENKIRKLTFDLGLGAEVPLGGSFYAFADARAWLPASSHTSPYLHHQRNVPLPVMVATGLRVLFGLRH